MIRAEQALIPYAGRTSQDRAEAWRAMLPDARRRRVMEAAQAHDAETLVGLADAWLTLHSRRKAATSPSTRANYEHGIRELLGAWRQEDLLKATGDAAASWISRLQDNGLAPSTLVVYRAAGRVLYRALRWAGATDADPFKDATVPADATAPWEKRKPYPDDDLEALLQQAAGDDRVLVLLGAHAGLRVSEMLALRWADVDLTAHQLTVRAGKGGKRRTVTVSKSLLAALHVWRAVCLERETGSARDYVLPYRAAISARRRLRLLCERAGVKPRAVHSLRHAAGTRIVREGGDLERAARHLGHASLETARIYAKWSDEALKRQVGAW
jgi:integrase